MPHGKKTHFDSLSDKFGRDGCSVCAFLREFQSRCLRSLDSEEVRTLCGFHAWQVASIVNAITAAKIFLRLIDKSISTEYSDQKCDLCARIRKQEDSKVREFCNALNEHDFQAASSKCRCLCLRHTTSVSARVPAGLRSGVHSVLQIHVTDLKRRLFHLLSDSNAGQTQHAGILGRAAEFLVAQRGLKND